jgi:xanthine dehydrogenase molybdopterin-binding subunit B
MHFHRPARFIDLIIVKCRCRLRVIALIQRLAAKSGSVERLESRDKVTGRAEYTHLMQLPGMLHANLFCSTVAHGRVGSVNVSLASRLPEYFM